jgi:diaminohydroxyphosphoribosylaminopyrimidine deaminase / 5-amino-6-(5-phosphoribosylamino)uracil reductase
MPVADLDHMRHAVVLAARGVGRTGRVPSVGCVIVAPDGRVIARARTDESGRPHAEAAALAQAGNAARGATVYVTLEPCAHVGKTGGPCADAVIAAAVARVVIACVDPDPRTDGQGIAKLKAAGIAVNMVGDAADTLDGFFTHIRHGRPHVALKIAQSLDGKTASASGHSQWITNEQSRRFGHLLRARSDAILVGVNTALADDPMLTVRLPGLEQYSPVRVVLDSTLRLPPNPKLAPALVYTCADGAVPGCEAIKVVPDTHGRPDLAAVLADLARRGVARLLVEGGATVHAAFLDAGLADALEVFTAPVTLGAAGHSAVGPLAEQTLGSAAKFTRTSRREFGDDVLESYVRKA